ncbi:DUF254-domain-containing protein [Yamadazyma tenuis ATCC 10573]|uniref:Vacuolar fusion protein MON1 n=2 Tax=Candida tenuis TaxID=2315449 RepID=G3B3N2_CANTC|nr:DUF254-domain-containing protein [Yamadazyma tenuis ATCC 10573]EGV64191.1 DUF254-domain-containing protein [Yamadazyma tenuis ATCC 10573]
MFLNRSPVVLVSVTKIKYEMILNQNTNQNSLLVNQLHSLYEYLVSILTKPVIMRLFHNRMNYDLRKSLTQLDFHNLDRLAMKLTYGLDEDDDLKHGLDYYLSALMDNSSKTACITNTTRQKLNSILLSSRTNDLPDYLFGLLTVGDQVVSVMKPKTHELGNKDVRNLMMIISNNQHSNMSEDLWIPICMPNFNSNGFLYCLVKTFDLSKYLLVDGKFHRPLPVNVVLLSTDKNNFFKMQEVAEGIIDQVVESDSYRNSLHDELVAREQLVTKPSMVHYVYKDKSKDQFVSSPLDLTDKFMLFKYVYYYTNLVNSKTTTIKSLTSDGVDKKLTYLKFDNYVGFMLSDQTYEFYCISTEGKLTTLINDVLGVVKWCKQRHKRLFNNNVRYSL